MITLNRNEFLQRYEKHQEWLLDNTRGKRLVWDFKIDFNFEFSFILDLRYANLRYANLSSADLRYANLRYANLNYADLSYADLDYANLSYANLSYANLSSANLSSADLSSANLSSADIDYSSWGLSCKTRNVKLCKRLQAQLLGHTMNVSPDVNFSKEQVQFVKDNWPLFEEFCNDRVKAILQLE